MSPYEMSYEFDILYNNIMSNAAPGLTEYEKSVFLTQAQEQLVVEIYNGKFNGKSFENSAEITKYLENLVEQRTINTFSTSGGISKHSQIADLRDGTIPSNILFPTLEIIYFEDGSEGYVKPITQDQYIGVSRNPFRRANKRRVPKLTLSNDKVELISEIPIKTYIIRYLKKPYPIILETIGTDDPSINGYRQSLSCELDSMIHRSIIIRAVQIAKMVWEGNINITK